MKSHNVSVAKLETQPHDCPFLVLSGHPNSLLKRHPSNCLGCNGVQQPERYVSYLMGHRKWATFIAGITQRACTSDEFRPIFQDMCYIILPKYSFILLIWRASLFSSLLRSLHSPVAKKGLHHQYNKIISCPIWSKVSLFISETFQRDNSEHPLNDCCKDCMRK